MDEPLEEFVHRRRSKKVAEKKKADIKKNLQHFFEEALATSTSGSQGQAVIKINVTLNTDLGMTSDVKTHSPTPSLVIKKEESERAVDKSMKFEDVALSPLTSIKKEVLDDSKHLMKRDIELDGQWPHVEVELIPQSLHDDEVVILHTDMPIQTSPEVPKEDVKLVTATKPETDYKSLHEMFAETKEAKNYVGNSQGLFSHRSKIQSNGRPKIEPTGTVGSIELPASEHFGHAMNPSSSTNMGNSIPTATSDTSFKFQQTLAKPFSNLVESSLTTRRLFGHSSKLATTKSPNISPIIAPSRLSLSNLPQAWRPMPPPMVSNVEIDTIEKNIARKLKISQKTNCPHTTSMAVSEDPPHTTGRKKSSVKKLADLVQKKSSKFRHKLRSAVVRPRIAKKDATQDENSKKPSLNVESSAGNNETNISSEVATSEQVDENITKPDTPEMDENSPKLDLMLSQHSKKTNYINIENDTDSSMKGAADEVSNRSLGEIFADKAMFDSSSHESLVKIHTTS